MQVLVFFATGFEEIEALATVDILRRANVETKMISVSEQLNVTGAHGITVVCDELLKDVLSQNLPDAVVFPGATNLSKNEELKDFTIQCYEQNKKVCAICASPAVVLFSFGLLQNHEWTCYPNMETETDSDLIKNWKESKVVVSGNLITSRGPGTTSDFAYTILQELGMSESAQKLKTGMLFC